jgi:hypothetical protein
MRMHVAIALLLAVVGSVHADLPTPTLVAGPTAEPPTIDGFIDDPAWRDAACVSGFIALGTADVSPLVTAMYVTFDDERLYMAMDAKIAGGRPNAQAVKRDGGVWGGDSVEISIAPPWMEAGQYYHVIANYLDSVFDMVKLDTTNDKTFDAKWDGDWQLASNVWEGVWTLELSVPLADLRVDDPAGDWRFNFGRTEGRYSAWSFPGRGYHNAAALGTVRFDRDAVLRSRINTVEGVKEGEMLIAGEVRNLGDTDLQATATVTIQPVELALGARDDELAKAVIEIEQTIAVLAGGVAPVRIERTFEDRALDLLRIEVRSDRGDVLARSAIPFQLQPRGAIEVIPHPSEDHAVITVDMRRVSGTDVVDLHGELLDSDGKTVQSFTWPAITGEANHFQRDFDLTDVPLGSYTFNFQLTAGDRTLRSESSLLERRATPQWYTEGRELGLPVQVVAPWTPVEHDGNMLRVWGREYTLGKSLFFDQIEAKDAPLLREPIMIEAEIGGDVSLFNFAGRTFESEADTAVAWTTSGSLGRVAVDATCTLEFDGMTRVDLTLRSDEPMTIDKLRLRIPMTAADSDYYHTCRTYYDNAQAGYVPDEGLSMLFTPYVWLGSLKRGLMWFAESPRGWEIDGEPIRVVPAGETSGGGGRDMVIEFIQSPITFDGERTITFGLHSTPVKPMPDGWRGTILGDRFEHRMRLGDDMIDWRMYRGEGGDRFGFWTNEQGELIKVGHTSPLKHNFPVIREKTRDDATRGIRGAIYHYIAGASPGRTTDFERYVRNWESVPGRAMAFGEYGDIHGACLGGTWADFLLFGAKTEVEQGGLSGVYWDGGGAPSLCRNPLHGHGSIDATTNRREAAFPIFEARRFMQRLATLYEREVGAGEWIIWNHNSQTMPLPFVSFSTAVLDGESPFQSVREGGPTFPEMVDLDYLRVAATGEHFGIVPTWLVYYRPGDPSVLRATYATIAAHGTPIYPLGGVVGSEPDRDLTLAMWRAYLDFDIRHAQFVGYWDSAAYLTAAPTEPVVLVSMYLRSDDAEYLLVVSNITKQPHDVTIELDASKFNLSGRTARDLLRDGEPVTLDGHTLTTHVGPEDFRLIAIR